MVILLNSWMTYLSFSWVLTDLSLTNQSLLVSYYPTLHTVSYHLASSCLHSSMAGCFLSILDFLLLCFLCKICLQYNTEAQQGKEITFVGSVFYLFILFIIFFFLPKMCHRIYWIPFPKRQSSKPTIPWTFLDLYWLCKVNSSCSVFIDLCDINSYCYLT